MGKRIFYQFIRRDKLSEFIKIISVYISGIIFGCFISIFVSNYFSFVSISELLSRTTLSGLMAAVLTPVALGICLNHYPYVWAPIIFAYSFLLGFVGLSFSFVFKGAAWLIRPLLMFSSRIGTVFLLWCLITRKRILNFKIVIALFVIAFSFVLLDYFIISKFAFNLLAYF